MNPFWRKRTKAESGMSPDERILHQLQKMGADLELPRRFDHFIYCDDAVGALSLEQQARAGGWQTERVVPGHHGIVASRSDWPVNVDTVGQARRFFEELAGSVRGGDYDGWGAVSD